jgi:4-hydroxythreonine-4-phosphate dehydrogenase
MATGRALALTLGEPAGIGPDITLIAWQRRAELALPPFYLLADPECIARRARRLGIDAAIELVQPASASAAFARALPVVPLGLPATAEPGQPDATSAPAAIASIDRAVADVIDGAAAAVVTNPVAKNVLYRSGFADPGHTEYLAKLSFERTGHPAWPVMMLWSPELAVVPVTIHLPIKYVRDRPRGCPRPDRALRDCPSAAGGRRPQSARRRGRCARRRGRERGAAGG